MIVKGDRTGHKCKGLPHLSGVNLITNNNLMERQKSHGSLSQILGKALKLTYFYICLANCYQLIYLAFCENLVFTDREFSTWLTKYCKYFTIFAKKGERNCRSDFCS